MQEIKDKENTVENSNIVKILEELYSNKNLSELFQKLKDKKDEESLYFLGKIHFIRGDIGKAISYFEKSNNFCEAAKCKFIKKDVWGAKNLLKKEKKDTQLLDWLNFLVSLVEDNIERLPTFFEVRNFLEVDLSLLFDFNNIDFAEKIVNNSHFFVQANSEANKFFGRVLYNYRYNGLAHLFLDKSFDVFYNDPETHFLKAQCYIAENKKEEAKKHLKYCLECADNYFPARKLLKEIE